nr:MULTISPECIES: iron chelate uptake ABC transporter family permease subunit [Microbacterium]
MDAGVVDTPGVTTLRLGGFSTRVRRRAVIVCVILAAVVVAGILAQLALGTYTVSVPDIFAALMGQADERVRMVVVDWRLPRALAAAAFGAALGLSGAVFQTLTQNPLGSPDVIGFDMGSFTGVLLVMLAGGAGFAAIAGGATAGGLITALAVYLLAFKRGVQGFRLIIVGIALAAMLASLNAWIMVKVDVDFAMQAAVWGAGTLNGVTWAQVLPSLAVIAVLLVLIALAAPRLRQLELGDELAGLQGLPVERTKITMIALGIAFTAIVTATAGPIAFVALAAPQVARRLTRTSASVDLVTSALTGAALLTFADLIAQHALPGITIPVGAVTVCIGGVYLVWLLARETKSK